jgi:heterodisulfide reductase subunit A
MTDHCSLCASLLRQGMIEVTIDGQPIEVEDGATILEAAQKLGIEIPTLCHHPALEPYGACRLCTVEITQNGRSRLVTSCNYPIRSPITVQTASEKVLRGRRLLAELLLARCPNASEIRSVAVALGVTSARFRAQDELCYLCGLCVRVCEELVGQSAISFYGRGGDREVGPPFLKFSDDCIACGACAFICPTGAITLRDITDKEPRPLPLEFDLGLANRGSVFIPFPQAVPKVPVIDRDHCLHFTLDRCGVCELSCEAQAIDYDQEDQILDLVADTIIVATGFDPFDPAEMPEYGYGQYPQVMTGLEFERLVSASGPTSGKIKLNGKEPQEVVFIQCVGSRDEQHGHAYCSRVCCMYTAKQAHLVCEKLPDASVTIFYMDVRAFGKGFEEFYDRVRRDGVIYRRGNPSEIVQNGDRLLVRAEDTLLGEAVEVEADLVVLAVGVEPRADSEEMARLLGLNRSPDGFLQESHPKLRPVDTESEGIYLAGCCQSPKDIPDTVAQAKAAAAAAMIRLAQTSAH